MAHPPSRAAIGFLTGTVIALALLGAGCRPPSDPSTAGSASGTVTVSAAASLTGAFGAARTAFEAANPGTRVTINSGASSTLASQIISGAPVDVFASADRVNMTKVSDAGLLTGPPVTFATNSLRIIVRKGNPSGLRTLADLTRPGLVYVTCSDDVPIGRYASRALHEAGVDVTPRSLEPDVRGIVAKVVAGEADAGIVYSTDVDATDGAATGIDIPAAQNVVVEYPIAVLADSTNRAAAQAWIDFVLSSNGRAILEQYGFGPP